MTLNTPNRGYPYPEYTDANNVPSQLQALATAVDNDLLNFLETPITERLDTPSVRVTRSVGTQAVAANVNVVMQYDPIETYDNDNMYNSGVSNTNIVVNTTGTYLLTGSVNLAPTGVAGGSVALIVMSSGATTPNPVGASRPLDNDKATSISVTTLHRANAAEILTLIVRHNHGGALTASGAQFAATRIA